MSSPFQIAQALDGGSTKSNPCVRFLLHRTTRYLLSWLLALGAASLCLSVAWSSFDSSGDECRRDGNSGHATIDFGGQYLLGRMVLLGYGQHLYERNYQRQVLGELYPAENQAPNAETSDVENLMAWMIGEDDPLARQTEASFVIPLAGGSSLGSVLGLAVGQEMWHPSPRTLLQRSALSLAAADCLGGSVLLVANRDVWPTDCIERLHTGRIGGPLYPPIDALLYAPVSLVEPHRAYRLSQLIGILLGFSAALAVSRLTRGRVWLPVAAAVLFAFPGFAGGIDLGQNAPLTLNLVMWGWVLISGEQLLLGGLVWGLLAFKPVWWGSFFLVPLVTKRWRTCLGMTTSATIAVLATVPIVGWHSWIDWVSIGREAVPIYRYDRNWIELSRDLAGIPRRWLDFEQNWRTRRDNTKMLLLGVIFYSVPFVLTAAICLARRRAIRATHGPGAAFLLLGAWMASPHFMYYDVSLAYLPVVLLFVEPGRYLEPLPVAIIPLWRGAKQGRVQSYGVGDGRAPPDDLPLVQPTVNQVVLLNRVEPTILVLLLSTVTILPWFGYTLRKLPVDTWLLVLLWAWCGWLILRGLAPESAESGADLPPKESASVNASQLVELARDIG